MSTGGGFVVNVKVDDRAVLAGLRAQRRGIRMDIKEIMLDAAEIQVVPVVKAFAVPTRMKRTWVARSNTNGAWITTVLRGKGRRIIGLLNFGGTVRTTIRPKNVKALHFGNGEFAASVSTPRHYKGKRFVEKAVNLQLRAFSAHVEREMTKRLAERIASVRSV